MRRSSRSACVASSAEMSKPVATMWLHRLPRPVEVDHRHQSELDHPHARVAAEVAAHGAERLAGRHRPVAPRGCARRAALLGRPPAALPERLADGRGAVEPAPLHRQAVRLDHPAVAIEQPGEQHRRVVQGIEPLGEHAGVDVPPAVDARTIGTAQPLLETLEPLHRAPEVPVDAPLRTRPAAGNLSNLDEVFQRHLRSSPAPTRRAADGRLRRHESIEGIAMGRNRSKADQLKRVALFSACIATSSS